VTSGSLFVYFSSAALAINFPRAFSLTVSFVTVDLIPYIESLKLLSMWCFMTLDSLIILNFSLYWVNPLSY